MKSINAFRIAVVVGVAVYAITSSGCAIVPNTVRVEFDHSSHMTQHAPFSNAGTNYGSNVANVLAHWDTPGKTFIEIGEGVSLDRRWKDTNSCGDVIGPREQFSLRIGKTFQLK
ncbi:MAG TPA: hypothetical protein VGO37_05785 [Steroidobacteraceae bacterium]|jgi:hypothetical protein|nr:hypothetical protein [Steroidobacteraceae bacterium]